jgi:hypothetical protein
MQRAPVHWPACMRLCMLQDLIHPLIAATLKWGDGTSTADRHDHNRGPVCSYAAQMITSKRFMLRFALHRST